MNHETNILLEILFSVIQFAALLLLFYKLYYQDSKVKRILLVIFIALWCILHNIISSSFFSFHWIIKILLQVGMYALIVIFAGGKKRNVCITAIYLWSFNLLVDLILACLLVGFTPISPFSNNVIFYVGTGIEHIAMFLWAVLYFSVMRSTPQEALNRIPLRFWLIVILTPSIGGITAFFADGSPFRKQLEAGFNNFLILAFFGIILLIFDLFIFYLFIKLVTAFNSRLLAGELNKAPPVYTPQNGFSAEFIEKYKLSKRQTKIAEAVIQGKSNKEISNLMDIEVNTVQVHLQNVYRKTGTTGRYALMALVGLGNR
jgi:DNA-binding CsgD family transcriptional regulator